MGSELDLNMLLGDDIAEQLASLGIWQVSEPVAEEGRTNYRIQTDGASFSFYTSEGSNAVLEWETDIPNVLLAGGNARNAGDFIELTTLKLPRYLYNATAKEKTIRNTFGQNSRITINYVDKKRVVYRLNNIRNILKFDEDFTSPESVYDIKSIIVNGQRDSGNSIDGNYSLGIELHQPDKGNRGVIRMGLPLTPEGAQAFNPRFLNWVFSTHEGFQNPTPNLERYLPGLSGKNLAAEELSGIIRSKFPQS